MNAKKEGFSSTKSIVAIALLLFCLLCLIGLFKFGSILALIMVYPWILSKVSGVVFNQYLAQLIALPITMALVYGVFKLVFSFSKKKRTAGLILLIALFMLHAGFMFIVTKDQYFQPLTGAPQKYYTTNPLTGEIQVFDQPIFDVFGQKAKVVNPQIAQELQARKMYPNTEIPAEKIVNFFDRTTGNPLVWYDVVGESFHFFLRPGFSPATGRELKPVTPEIAEEFLKKRGEISVQPPVPIAPAETTESSHGSNLIRDSIKKYKGSLYDKENNKNNAGPPMVLFMLLFVSFIVLGLAKMHKVSSGVFLVILIFCLFVFFAVSALFIGMLGSWLWIIFAISATFFVYSAFLVAIYRDI